MSYLHKYLTTKQWTPLHKQTIINRLRGCEIKVSGGIAGHHHVNTELFLNLTQHTMYLGY